MPTVAGARKERRKEARLSKKAARRWGHEAAQQWRAQQRQQRQPQPQQNSRPDAAAGPAGRTTTPPVPSTHKAKRRPATHETAPDSKPPKRQRLNTEEHLSADLPPTEPSKGTKKKKKKKQQKTKGQAVADIETPPADTPLSAPSSSSPSHSSSATPAVAAYVPPQLRKASATEDKVQRLRMSLRSLFNKLSEGNLASILQQLLDLQATAQQSRHDFTQAVCDVMLDCTVEDVRLTHMIMYPFAAIVRALQLLQGNEVAAHCLRQAALRFQAHLAQGQRHQAYNALYLLCALYTFHVIESRLIYGVIHLLALGDREIHVELLLLVLKACGPGLRTDDPTALQGIIAEINARQKVTEDEATGVRRRMMVDFINDLRSKGKALKHSQEQYSAALWERLNRVVAAFAHKAQVPTKVSLDVAWETVVQPEVRGWWWEAAEMKGVAQRHREAVEAKASLEAADDGSEEEGSEVEEEGEEAAEQWAEEEGREEGGYDLYGPPAGRGGAAPGAKARPAPGQAAAESGPAKEGIWFKGRLLNPDDVYDMSDMSDAGEGLEDDEEIESGSDVVSDPEQAQEPAPKTKKAKTAKTKKKRKADPDAGDDAEDLTALARAQSLTTPMKRVVFAAVMEAVDLQECFVRLVRLDLHRNARDICAVLAQLCLQEKGYNPYYAALLHRLCTSESPRQVIYSTQCAIWTQFKVLSMVPASLNRFLNLTHLIISLLLKGDLTLGVLK
eukprot:EG_transcript_4265